MSSKHKRAGNPSGGERTADTHYIRVAMMLPLKTGDPEITLPMLRDMIIADTGRCCEQSSLCRTILGNRHGLRVQKAIARALGLPLDEAFPIDPARVKPPAPKTIGGRIRIERERRSWTIVDLAKKMGLTFSAISHWETNRNAPPPAQLLKLAIILGVTYHWLHAGLPPRKPQRQQPRGNVGARHAAPPKEN